MIISPVYSLLTASQAAHSNFAIASFIHRLVSSNEYVDIHEMQEIKKKHLKNTRNTMNIRKNMHYNSISICLQWLLFLKMNIFFRNEHILQVFFSTDQNTHTSVFGWKNSIRIVNKLTNVDSWFSFVAFKLKWNSQWRWQNVVALLHTLLPQ